LAWSKDTQILPHKPGIRQQSFMRSQDLGAEPLPGQLKTMNPKGFSIPKGG